MYFGLLDKFTFEQNSSLAMKMVQQQIPLWSTVQLQGATETSPLASLCAHPRFGLGGAFISAPKLPCLHKWIICSLLPISASKLHTYPQGMA